MKKDLKKRLKSYSLTAGAVIAAGAAEGQVIYTDINPDVTKTNNGDFYDLDLNNDVTVDFRLNLYESFYSSTSFPFFFSYQRVTIDAMGLNSIAATTSSYVRAMNAASSVGSSISTWANSSYNTLGAHINLTIGTIATSVFYGNWVNVTDKYLGLKIVISGQTHYGWARLDVNLSSGAFTIKDYAYESTPNQPILTGIILADVGTNVMATDIDDNGNGSDMKITFDKAANEATVDEYRVMVVKAAAAGSFDLIAAQAVTTSNFMAIMPNGMNIDTVLAAGATDTDGDAIALGIPYRVFVLSIADGVIAMQDALSNPSPVVSLNTTVDAALGLDAQDIANSGMSSDFRIGFDKANDESGISEYRAIVVKSADAATFNLTGAQAVAAGNYTAITPTGANIQQTLNNGDKDKDGDFIAQNTPYKFFVLSIADGTTANLDSLSAESNELIMQPFTGIGELSDKTATIYSSGQQITIDIGQLKFNSGSIRISDMSGKLIGQFSLKQPKTVLDLHVDDGIYIVTMEADGQQFTKKVLLNR